jgi:hypothetical protein
LAELNSFIGTDKPIDLALVEKWERTYGGTFERLELKDGAGKAYTSVEKKVGRARSLALTEDDPLPQTIFRVSAKPGNPLVVRLPLRIGK